MGIFDGYKASAKPTGNHTYLLPGRYLATIAATKIVKKRNGSEAFVNELSVNAVLVRYQDPTYTGTGDAPLLLCNPKGTTGSHMINPGNYFDGDLKSMAMAIEGMDEAAASDEETGITLEYLLELTGPTQPKRGTVIEVNAQPIVTGEGKLFTRVEYVRSNLPHHEKCITDEEIAEAVASSL